MGFKHNLQTICVALAVMALPGPAPAYPLPDYIGYSQQVEPIAQFLSMNELCSLLGYTIAPDVYEKTMIPAIFWGTQQGLSHDAAMTIAVNAQHRAYQDEQEIAELFGSQIAAAYKADNLESTTKITLDYYGYIHGKCTDYADSYEFGRYVTAPAGRQIADGFNSFMDWVGQEMPQKQ